MTRVGCFMVVKKLLDAAWHEIPGDDSHREGLVKTAFDRVTKGQLTALTGTGVDYSKPEARYAHVFLHAAPHACWVYHILGSESSHGYRLLLKNERCTVCIIGGGAGSDLLGVLKYCAFFSYVPRVRCVVFDNEPAWGKLQRCLVENVPDYWNLELEFQCRDLAEASEGLPLANDGSPVLIIDSYCASELYRRQDGAAEHIRRTFPLTASTSRWLHVDIDHMLVNNWWHSVIKSVGFSVTTGRANWHLPADEHRDQLEAHHEKFTLGYPDDRLFYMIGAK